ncbi:MAG: EscU/YscU/HrcU family type III secretion system export apparatus switch protein [Eisenbergiella sp.]
MENRPLARALYAECKLDRQIPAQYYGAVAEILIYVFRANQKWSSNR